MKKNKLKSLVGRMLIGLLLPVGAICQNVGIGVDNPVRALLEVHGASGTGTTSALFGGEHGISFQKSYPAIGFNLYRDNNTLGYRGKYMQNGCASMMSLNYNANEVLPGFVISTYPAGSIGGVLPAGINNLSLFNYQFALNSARISRESEVSLIVGRGTGIDGTAAFSGTNFTSFFNFRSTEHTYIRGGKPGSRVFINDFYKGNIIIGSNNARVGVNAPDPQYSFEVRQVNGSGIKMIRNSQAIDYSWEWRTGGTPSHLYAFYNNAAKTSFNNIDGALAAISDARLKTNITLLPSLIDRIVRLNPVTYEVKEDNPTRFKSTGFLAQEVNELFSQLVTRQDSTEMLGIYYSGFQVLAIKGIQEEQVKLTAIEHRALELETKMKLLERSLPASLRHFP